MQRMDFDAYCEQARSLGVLGMNVTKDDQLLVSWRSEGECRRNIYSATKSFTACAVGFAQQEGLLSLEEKLTDAFSRDIPPSPCENLRKATVRDQRNKGGCMAQPPSACQKSGCGHFFEKEERRLRTAFQPVKKGRKQRPFLV